METALSRFEGESDQVIARLVEAARALYAKGPCHFDTMRDHLQGLYPDADERAMGYAVRTLLPLVMVPTQADWGFPAQADFTTSEAWLGRAPEPAVTCVARARTAGRAVRVGGVGSGGEPEVPLPTTARRRAAGGTRCGRG